MRDSQNNPSVNGAEQNDNPNNHWLVKVCWLLSAAGLCVTVYFGFVYDLRSGIHAGSYGGCWAFGAGIVVAFLSAMFAIKKSGYNEYSLW